jgi:type IV pilus assembly protein PilB
VQEAIEDSDERAAPVEIVDLRESADDAPVIRLVRSIIGQAAERGASDIHFEPQPDEQGRVGREMRVRMRIDGVLTEEATVPKGMIPGVISRIKIMSDLNIAERRLPQDGRVGLTVDGRHVDLRVVTIPSVHGEAVVIRILDKESVALDLNRLGMGDQELDAFRRSISRAHGAVLTTGPTGSGKSTTLYGALLELNTPERNIITIEDPVEYQIKGITQMQVNLKAGLTFASGLRSMMRADPDVLMVGEIRDRETAQIAVEGALTGHMVLSTLHTNDAPGALTRLNEMGVEPFLTGSAVTAVLAQRLARKLCTHCCEMYTPSVADLIKAKVSPDVAAMSDGMALYRKRGCPRCNQTGYRGRIGIYQLMMMNEELETLAAQKASREDIERSAMNAGMRTLWDDGLGKVAAGLTSVEELARVTT